MKLGAIFPTTEIGPDPVAVRDFAQAAEGLGYSYLIAFDHVIGADPSKHTLIGPYTHNTQFHEPFVLFGYLAALTRRIELMTGILILPQRQTALVAKQAAEVDLLTGGRLVLGVGNGWNQVEYEVLGEDFHVRGRRMGEQLRLLRLLWEQPLVEFEGRFDSISAAGINPRPQRRIPIWIGGMAQPVLRRIGRYADGWLPRQIFDDFERMRDDIARRRERIRQAAVEAGRDPAAIGLAIEARLGKGDIESAVRRGEQWKEAGATHCAIHTMDAGLRGPAAHIEAIRAFRETAGSALD
jgi:probable F420-dependent oxidoreductase